MSSALDQTSESEKLHQQSKYAEILEILLSAGYFRARINTLSEFDKVVGGLCWCITSSGEDVDVDILFQENSTIGQRISLSEAIVTALRKMACPSPLQPHQIQGGVGGSDYAALHPVIVWLVKKFFERREEREAALRAYSTLQFSKNFKLPSESDNFAVSAELAKILARNRAVRTYRRRETKSESEETRVHSCLLEYGEKMGALAGGGGGGSSGGDGRGGAGAGGSDDGRFAISDGGDISLAGLSSRLASGGGADLSGFEKKLMQAAKEAQREEKILAENASREEAELMQQMSQIDGDGDTVGIAGSSLQGIVGLGSSEIGSAAAAYELELEESRRLLDSNLGSGKLGQAAAYKRQRQHLLKQRDEIDAKAVEVSVATEVMLERLRIIEEEHQSASDYNSKLQGQVVKLTELEGAASQQEELAILKNLVMLNENLRAQEAEFKASCKAQVQEYTARIKALEEADNEGSESNRKLRDIEDMHTKVMAKYNRLRQMLSEMNLEVASNARIIDDIPTRTELIQYERRFVELYQQVAWKLEETRKYYAMYNTLETSLKFIQQEIKLLDSISENFAVAMRSSQGKEEFLRQFDQITRSVEDALGSQEQMLVIRDRQVEELKGTNQNVSINSRHLVAMQRQKACTHTHTHTHITQKYTRVYSNTNIHTLFTLSSFCSLWTSKDGTSKPSRTFSSNAKRTNGCPRSSKASPSSNCVDDERRRRNKRGFLLCFVSTSFLTL